MANGYSVEGREKEVQTASQSTQTPDLKMTKAILQPDIHTPIYKKVIFLLCSKISEIQHKFKLLEEGQKLKSTQMEEKDSQIAKG